MSQQEGQNPLGRMAVLAQANTASSSASTDMAPTTVSVFSSNSQELLLQQEIRRASAVRLQLERETQMAQAYQAGLEFACNIVQQKRQQQAVQHQPSQVQPQHSLSRLQLLDHASSKIEVPAVTTVPSSSFVPLATSTPTTPHPANSRSTPSTSRNIYSSMSNLVNAWTTAPAARDAITTTTSAVTNRGRHVDANVTSTSNRTSGLDEWTTTFRAKSREVRDVDRTSAERRVVVRPPDLATAAFRSTNSAAGHSKATSVHLTPVRSTNWTTQRPTGATVVPVAPVRAPSSQTTVARAALEVPMQSTTATRTDTPAKLRWEDIARNIRLPDVPPGATRPLPPTRATDPNHLVVYVKYRIAELRQRKHRNPLEDHFLNLLFEWARKAEVALPQASEYDQLIDQVLGHRRIYQSRSHPSGTTSSGIQKTNLQSNISSVPTNLSAATTVTPRAAAFVSPHVSRDTPTATTTPEQTSNHASAVTPRAAAFVSPPVSRETPTATTALHQTSNLASAAAIEKAKPPAVALMALLKIGQPVPPKERMQSQIANAGPSSSVSSTGASSVPSSTATKLAISSIGNLSATAYTGASKKGPLESPKEKVPSEITSARPSSSTSTTGPLSSISSTGPLSGSANTGVTAQATTSNSGSHAAHPLSMADATLAIPEDSADIPLPMADTTLAATENLADIPLPTAKATPVVTEKLAALPLFMTNATPAVTDNPSVGAPDAVASISEIVAPPPREATPEPRGATPEPREATPEPREAAPEPGEVTPELCAPAPKQETPEDPYGVVNMRTIRSIPVNRMWVEIPVARPRPIPPRPRSLSPRRFNFCLPEQTYERFDRDCHSEVLSRTLMKRTNLRPCGWDGCDAELGSEWQLEQHVRKVHVPRAKPVKLHHTEVDAWVCNWDSCHRPYATPEHLDQHLQAVHVQQGLVCPYRTCLHRDTVFPNVHVLEIHIARSPVLHKRENVVPLVDLSVAGPIPMDCQVPATIRCDAVLPVKVFRAIWSTDRVKRNAINKVQEFSFFDRESPRLRPGESPPPVDMPMPAPVLQEDDSAADDDTIVVKSKEGTTPYTLRRTHQSDKADLVKAKTGSKPIKREMELEVVIELSRPLIKGV